MIPGLTKWVKDLVLLWCRPAAVALIQPPAWEPPYAIPVALKSKQESKQASKQASKKERKKEKGKERKERKKSKQPEGERRSIWQWEQHTGGSQTCG